jgi:hypothetical protein
MGAKVKSRKGSKAIFPRISRKDADTILISSTTDYMDNHG